MNELDNARTLWIEEEPRFAQYAGLVADQIRHALRPAGVWYDVSQRAKSIDSLLKKLLKKTTHTYETLPDKAGVRVIVRYRADLERVIPLLQAALHCGRIDTKAPRIDAVGYLSTHVDHVRLPATHPEQRFYEVNHFWVELQIRTLAQHLWSEMSHDTVYKNDETILVLPNDVKRRVSLMAGQIEIADREFDRLGQETRAEDAAELLRFLERTYFRLTSRKPDVELSLSVLRTLVPLYGTAINQIESTLQGFLTAKMSFLEDRYAQAQEQDAVQTSPLFFQPEALAIYERLTDDQTTLRREWSLHYPDEELEKIASDFGISFY